MDKQSAFDHLDDEGKINHAIECVARGTPVPEALRRFLIDLDLYEDIINPAGE